MFLLASLIIHYTELLHLSASTFIKSTGLSNSESSNPGFFDCHLWSLGCNRFGCKKFDKDGGFNGSTDLRLFFSEPGVQICTNSANIANMHASMIIGDDIFNKYRWTVCRAAQVMNASWRWSCDVWDSPGNEFHQKGWLVFGWWHQVHYSSGYPIMGKWHGFKEKLWASAVLGHPTLTSGNRVYQIVYDLFLTPTGRRRNLNIPYNCSSWWLWWPWGFSLEVLFMHHLPFCSTCSYCVLLVVSTFIWFNHLVVFARLAGWLHCSWIETAWRSKPSDRYCQCYDYIYIC